MKLIDLVNSAQISSNLNFPTWVPECDSLSPALLDYFLSSDRAYLRKMKHLGIGCFVKNAFGKFFFLVWTRSVKNNFEFLTTLADLTSTCPDNPSVFLSNKGALLLKWRALFQEHFIQFFILNKKFLDF